MKEGKMSSNRKMQRSTKRPSLPPPAPRPRIPKKGERGKSLYRKVYTGFVCHMTDEPLYTWEKVK